MLLKSICLLVLIQRSASSSRDNRDVIVEDDGVQRFFVYRNEEFKSRNNNYEDSIQYVPMNGFNQRHAPEIIHPNIEHKHQQQHLHHHHHHNHRRMTNEEKVLRTEAFKANLLSKLRMSRPPNITSPILPRIPYIERKLRENVEKMQSDAAAWEEGDANAATLRMMHFCKSDDIFKTNACKFKIKTSKLRSQHVASATLAVYVKQLNPHTRKFKNRQTDVYVNLLNVLKDDSRQIYASKQVWEGYQGNWIEFNVKNLVQEWIHTPEANRGVEFVFDTTKSKVHAGMHQSYQLVVFAGNDDYIDKQPYLEIAFEDSDQPRRNRRHVTNVCEEGNQDYRCCRYPLHINFKDIGWDWIILPLSYEAYYCSGDCPLLFQQNHPYAHSASQTGIAAACCSAKSVSSIDLLYYDENGNIVTGKVPGMAVDACSCS